MTEGTRLAQLTGRAGLSLVAVGAAAALGAAALLVPPPAVAPVLEPRTITPDRADQRLACAGGALGLTLGDNPQVTVTAMPDLVVTGEGAAAAPLAASDALPAELPAEAVQAGATPPTVITLPAGAAGDRAAGTETLRLASPDLAGFTAAECASAERTAWLVGGDTTVGRTTWITLANPGPVDATVDLALYGAGGPLEAPGATGIIVAPGFQRVVALDGLAVDELSPVVGVTARTGTIDARLQTSTVRGLEPGGFSIVSPITAPSESLVIPGVPIVDPEAVQQRAGVDGSDLFPTLRLLAPGGVGDAGDAGADADASAAGPVEVSVRVIAAGDEGAAADEAGPPVVLTTVEPGAVVDLPFGDLPAGDWSFLVEASAPVVAAVRVSAVDPDPAALPGPVAGVAPSIDQQWVVPSPLLADGTRTLAAVGPLAGTTARLHLAAPDGAATVDLDGRLIEIPEGGAVTVPVAGSTPLGLTVDGAPVAASVSYRGDAAIATTRILAPRAAQRPLVVLVD